MNNVEYYKEKIRKLLSISFIPLGVILLTLMNGYVYGGRVVTENASVIESTSEDTFSLSMKNVLIKDVLFELQKISGYSFLFQQDELEGLRKKEFILTNSKIEEALTLLFRDTPYIYHLNGKTISILKQVSGHQADEKEQRFVVKGKVVDAKGEAIAGATVVITGTNLGSSTDAEGAFSIQVKAGESLTFSFIGMTTKRVTITKPTDSLTVTLNDDVKQMEEVIVTGMFTRKSGSFTGAVKTIKSDELERVGSVNLFQSLRNIDPSLNIMDNMEFGSDPNRLPEIQLRGTSAFPAGSTTDLRSNYQDDPNQPLFILDGFEVSAMKVFDMNMNRVESITILKDASAKAIYGSKAANGVIVIETKRPVSGDFRMSYKGSADLTIPDLTSYNLTNSLEKLEIEKIANLYNGTYVADYNNLKDKYNALMKAALEGLNTDWLSKPLQTGVGTRHSLSFEMGTQQVNALASVSYNHIVGVMQGSSRTTLSGDLNLSYRLNTRFLFRNIMSITSNKAEDSPYGSFSEYARMNPYHSAYDKNGNITSDNNNPLYNGTINTNLTSSYLEFTNNFYIEWNILNNLKAVARVGVTAQRNDRDIFYPANHTRFSGYTNEDLLRKGSYQQNTGKNNNLTGEFTLQYSKEIRKHFLLANFAFNISERNSHETIHYAEGFPSDRMDDISFALQYANGKTPGGFESIIRDIGFVGVLGYTYDNRFMADFTIRENASSLLGSDKKWGNFWSAGIGWNIHNEKWAEDLLWFKELKLRGSIGTTGSQAFSGFHNIPTYNYYTDASYTGLLGAYVIRMANKELKWQEKVDYNAGLDVRLGNLNLSFDYYVAYTDNLITDLSLPTSTGFESVKENIAKVRNNGIDINASYRIFSDKNGFLNITAALSSNNNKIIKLSDAMRAYNQRQDELANQPEHNRPVHKYTEGGSLSSIWGVPSLGINPSNGKEIYVKPDGTTTYEWRPEYQQIIGNSQEKIRGNFGFNGEYKGFGVSTIFRFLAGGEFYNQTLVDKVENADPRNNVDRRMLYGLWSETNKDTPFRAYDSYQMTRPTSRFVQKRNELTLSSLNVYYDWKDRKWLEKTGIERLKVSFNMNDICTISTIKMERGTSYPFARTMSISLTAEF